MDDRLANAATDLADATHAIALTGAGISAESGVPTYRGDDGLWERHDESDIHVRRFRSEPAAFWTDWLAFHDDAAMDDVEPNAGHEALADLESADLLSAILTQNVDGLHGDAGADSVLELHGTHREVVCQSCFDRFEADPVYERVREGERPPRCERCSGTLKPGSVLFGEQLPPDTIRAASDHVRACDCMLVVGSSLVVEPVGSMPERAADAGATLVEVNPDDTRITDRAAYSFGAGATEVLPPLRDAAMALARGASPDDG